MKSGFDQQLRAQEDKEQQSQPQTAPSRSTEHVPAPAPSRGGTIQLDVAHSGQDKHGAVRVDYSRFSRTAMIGMPPALGVALDRLYTEWVAGLQSCWSRTGASG